MALSRRQFNKAATIGTGGTMLQTMGFPWFTVKDEERAPGRPPPDCGCRRCTPRS